MMQPGFQFPDSFISVLRLGNAWLTANRKTLVMAAVQGSLDAYLPLAKKMRQISQPVGGTRKEGILINPPNTMADTAGVGDEDLSYDAWAAYCRAGAGRKDSQQTMRCRPRGNGRKQDEQVGNGFNQCAGERNRCRSCRSEFHFLPKSPERTNSSQAGPSPLPMQNYVPRSSFSPSPWIRPHRWARIPLSLRRSWKTVLSSHFRPHGTLVADWFSSGMPACFCWILEPQRI